MEPLLRYDALQRGRLPSRQVTPPHCFPRLTPAAHPAKLHACQMQPTLDNGPGPCLRSAWVSSLAIYNRLLQERPDLVRVRGGQALHGQLQRSGC